MMPIPRDLFDKGLDSLDSQIIGILNGDSDNAYTSQDLAKKVSQPISNPLDDMLWNFRLTNLADQGFIESRGIQGRIYYASGKRQN